MFFSVSIHSKNFYLAFLIYDNFVMIKLLFILNGLVLFQRHNAIRNSDEMRCIKIKVDMRSNEIFLH